MSGHGPSGLSQNPIDLWLMKPPAPKAEPVESSIRQESSNHKGPEVVPCELRRQDILDKVVAPASAPASGPPSDEGGEESIPTVKMRDMDKESVDAYMVGLKEPRVSVPLTAPIIETGEESASLDEMVPLKKGLSPSGKAQKEMNEPKEIKPQASEDNEVESTKNKVGQPAPAGRPSKSGQSSDDTQQDPLLNSIWETTNWNTTRMTSIGLWEALEPYFKLSEELPLEYLSKILGVDALDNMGADEAFLEVPCCARPKSWANTWGSLTSDATAAKKKLENPSLPPLEMEEKPPLQAEEKGTSSPTGWNPMISAKSSAVVSAKMTENCADEAEGKPSVAFKPTKSAKSSAKISAEMAKSCVDETEEKPSVSFKPTLSRKLSAPSLDPSTSSCAEAPSTPQVAATKKEDEKVTSLPDEKDDSSLPSSTIKDVATPTVPGALLDNAGASEVSEVEIEEFLSDRVELAVSAEVLALARQRGLLPEGSKVTLTPALPGAERGYVLAAQGAGLPSGGAACRFAVAALRLGGTEQEPKRGLVLQSLEPGAGECGGLEVEAALVALALKVGRGARCLYAFCRAPAALVPFYSSLFGLKPAPAAPGPGGEDRGVPMLRRLVGYRPEGSLHAPLARAAAAAGRAVAAPAPDWRVQAVIEAVPAPPPGAADAGKGKEQQGAGGEAAASGPPAGSGPSALPLNAAGLVPAAAPVGDLFAPATALRPAPGVRRAGLRLHEGGGGAVSAQRLVWGTGAEVVAEGEPEAVDQHWGQGGRGPSARTEVVRAWEVDSRTPDELGAALRGLRAELRLATEAVAAAAGPLLAAVAAERRTAELHPEEAARQESLRVYMAQMEEQKLAIEAYRRQVEEDMEANCVVCFDGEVHGKNQIVFCECCNTPVHQDCYAVPRLPAGDWFCRPCHRHLHAKIPKIIDQCQENPDYPFKDVMASDPELREVHISKEKIRCRLCPHQGAGGFLWAPAAEGGGEAEEDGWVHVNCARWAKLPMDKERGAVTGVGALLRATRAAGLQCCICDGTGGALVPCEAEHCNKYFHFFCGRKEQWDLFQPVAGDAWFRPAGEGEAGAPEVEPTRRTREARGKPERGDDWTAFCSVHSVRDTEKVKQVIRALPVIRNAGRERDENWHTWYNCHVCKIRKEVTTPCQAGVRFNKKIQGMGPCEIRFCDRCVVIQGDDYAAVTQDTTWTCYACQGNCRCAACKRLRAGGGGAAAAGAGAGPGRKSKKQKGGGGGGAPVAPKGNKIKIILPRAPSPKAPPPNAEEEAAAALLDLINPEKRAAGPASGKREVAEGPAGQASKKSSKSSGKKRGRPSQGSGAAGPVDGAAEVARDRPPKLSTSKKAKAKPPPPLPTQLPPDLMEGKPADLAAAAASLDYAICCVCDDKQDTADTRCSVCYSFYHRNCYELGKRSATPVCDSCTYLLTAPAEDPPLRCLLCPMPAGAMKRAINGNAYVGWVHPACAMWAQAEHKKKKECWSLSNYTQAENPEGCCLCGQREGHLLACEKEGCESLFHVVCARQANFAFKEDTEPDGTMRYAMQCAAHSPEAHSLSFQLAQLQRLLRGEAPAAAGAGGASPAALGRASPSGRQPLGAGREGSPATPREAAARARASPPKRPLKDPAAAASARFHLAAAVLGQLAWWGRADPEGAGPAGCALSLAARRAAPTPRRFARAVEEFLAGAGLLPSPPPGGGGGGGGDWAGVAAALAAAYEARLPWMGLGAHRVPCEGEEGEGEAALRGPGGGGPRGAGSGGKDNKEKDKKKAGGLSAGGKKRKRGGRK